MFLADTNVVSELRKGRRADAGVIAFLKKPDHEIFLPVQVIGELRRGVENFRSRGDTAQASLLEAWFQAILEEFAHRILVYDSVCAQAWGKLAGDSRQNPIDKQIAAIALIYDLTVVTRNASDFAETGVKVLNPFSGITFLPNP